MVFSSLIFLFGFLPLFLAVYYAVPFRYKSPVILVGSFFFYAWWRIDFAFLFAFVIIVNYAAAQKIFHASGTIYAKRWLQAGIVFNIATLAIFKYFNFGIDSLNALLNQSGLNSIEAIRFILPIGISFYIFQAISFLVDIYRGDAPLPNKFTDFAAFKSLFPQLIAGPVLRYKDLAGQFMERTHTLDKFSEGAHRFMIGFAKKVLVADTVAPIADAAFALENPSMADAWLGALAYTVQLYFDFSGYSDMAIGLALMMGFRFIENFNYPYISRSITEFWRRWHISLSTWLRDYLYIPLGGNRKGNTRTYINLILTMVIGGLWHGANWTFLLWGAWHGGIMAIERALNGKDAKKSSDEIFSLTSVPKVLLTFFLVIIGWVMFRAENVQKAFAFYRSMFLGDARAISDALSWQITGASLTALAIGLFLLFAVPAYQAYRKIDLKKPSNLGLQVFVIALFVFAVIRLGAANHSPFLYFQF